MPKYEKDKRLEQESSYVLGEGAARKAADTMRKEHNKRGEKLNSIMDEIRKGRGK